MKNPCFSENFIFMGTFHVLTVSEKRNYLHVIHILWPWEHWKAIYPRCLQQWNNGYFFFFLLYHFLYFPNILQLENGFNFFLNKTKLIGQESLCPRQDEHITANLHSDRWLGLISNWLSCCIAGPWQLMEVCGWDNLQAMHHLIPWIFSHFPLLHLLRKKSEQQALRGFAKQALTPAKNNNHFYP